jgi:hypothetical protein
MIWPEHQNLETIAESVNTNPAWPPQEEMSDAPKDWVGELSLRGLHSDGAPNADSLRIIKRICELQEPIKAADVTAYDDGDFITYRIGYMGSHDQRWSITEHIINGALLGLRFVDVDIEYVEMDRSNSARLQELKDDQENSPELDLDVTSGRYEDPEANEVFRDMRDKLTEEV